MILAICDESDVDLRFVEVNDGGTCLLNRATEMTLCGNGQVN